jgi:hypothetical protein
MIWGALKRADNIYTKADKVIEDPITKPLLPPRIYKIVSYKYEQEEKQEKSGPVLTLVTALCVLFFGRQKLKRESGPGYYLSLGLRNIVPVYISFMYASSLILC